VLFSALFCSPVVVGAFDLLAYTLVAIPFTVFAAYAFSHARNQLSKRIALVMLSVSFGVTLADVAARPLLSYLFEVRPAERFIYRWPMQRRLQRYVGDVSFEGVTYGDLAAVSGRTDWREERRMKFVTDGYGFRNEPGTNVGARPLDFIVLGDSFGVAAGTTQEETLSSLLERQYGASVYNLSISRENPQQEYANLLLEGKRLKARPGTRVVWLVFPGNDLDEPYYPELENPQPVSPGPLTTLIDGFADYRTRSPIKLLLSHQESELVIERRFVDGQPLLFFRPYAQRRSRTAEDIIRHPNFEKLKKTLVAMKQLASERGLIVSVAIVPSKEEVYSWVLDGAPPWSDDGSPSGFSTVLRQLCELNEFHFVDLKPSLVEASRRTYEKAGALLWWRDDSHWNGDGQRVAAETIYKTYCAESVSANEKCGPFVTANTPNNAMRQLAK
jgi:hypothetical protein